MQAILGWIVRQDALTISERLRRGYIGHPGVNMLGIGRGCGANNNARDCGAALAGNGCPRRLPFAGASEDCFSPSFEDCLVAASYRHPSATS